MDTNSKMLQWTGNVIVCGNITPISGKMLLLINIICEFLELMVKNLNCVQYFNFTETFQSIQLTAKTFNFMQ